MSNDEKLALKLADLSRNYPKPRMTKVYVLIEEEESGSNAAGDTYCPLGAYESEQDAQAAAAAWRAEHDFEPEDWEDPECDDCTEDQYCPDHDQEYLDACDQVDWCNCHGQCVVIEALEFTPAA